MRAVGWQGNPRFLDSQKARVDPTLLDTLECTGVNIDSDEEIQKRLEATEEMREDAFRELDKEQLLTHRLEWKWGASNVKGAFLALWPSPQHPTRCWGVWYSLPGRGMGYNQDLRHYYRSSQDRTYYFSFACTYSPCTERLPFIVGGIVDPVMQKVRIPYVFVC